ncbi:MAG: 4Fe-4S double cluster binding domain-containing protein [Dehalococcoidia bacterium]|nr:4Fe-4S double cluster binding domain-containing protein [Dehalococcoidia bacterium]
MDASATARRVLSRLEQVGCRGRIVSVQHVNDLKNGIGLSHQQGLFDEVFYRERLSGFQFRLSETCPEARSIIVTSSPQLQQKVTFRFEGRTLTFVVPPTYSGHTDQIAEKAIREALTPAGFTTQAAHLPAKLVAVRSGLAEYGRNNITYIEGWGSFHRLKVFLSDLPVVDDSWVEAGLMQQCRQCSACIKKCPTRAIPGDRFLIRAERCLTFHNEREGEFPGWIDPAWHNCLVGCMLCQTVCPANRGLRQRFGPGESFDEEETKLLTKGVSPDELPAPAADKLKRLGLLEDAVLISRNLNALLRQHLPRECG